MTKRIFVCEFKQESNSFNPVPSKWEDFHYCPCLTFDKPGSGSNGAGLQAAGIIDTVREAGMTPVGGVGMRAKSGGPLQHSVVERWLEENARLIRAAGKPDGVVLSLHGATVSDSSDDVCGDILSFFRELTGEETVIGVSLDLHANVTERMMKNADLLCGFQTYPHVDHYETGRRAAKLTVEKLNGKPLKTFRVTVPMMAPPHAYTTTRDPLRSLTEHGRRLTESGRIADFSVFQVQPWLDIPAIASSVITVSENEAAAKEAAEILAREEFALRRELLGGPLFSIDAVIREAIENKTEAPVILVDSADSAGAGSSGDSAAVLSALLPYRDTLHCAVYLNDPPAVEKAFSLGVGARADFTLGAALAPGLSAPVMVKDAFVRSLHSGEFILGGPAERGQIRNIGPAAVLRAGQIFILIAIRGYGAGDLQFYRSFGIEPTLCRLVQIKACTSFRAGYEKIAAKICNAETPGAAGTVLTSLPYTRLPAPLYPFCEISEDMISAPERFR